LKTGKIRFPPLLILKIADLQKAAEGKKEIDLGFHRRRERSLSHRNVFDGIHQFWNSHMLRTSFEAGVTGGAEPDELAGEDLFFHSEEGHADDSSRVVSVRNLPDRAPGGTGSTGETFFDVFSSGFCGDEKLKIGIEGFGIDHDAECGLEDV
jgi:hypothetical protein